MAGANQIRAGGAVVEVSADLDPLKKGLGGVAGQFRSFGTSLASVGSTIAATWATIASSAALAAVVTAVKNVTDLAGELSDMSARTGVSAEKLQFLAFAAKQTGTNLETVEAALRAMARKGLAVADFETLGQAMSGIADPTQRAGKMLDTFGKSGTQLIPLFQQWNELKAVSDAIGPLLTDEEVDRVDRLGDSFGALQEAIKRTSNSLAAKFSPELQEAAHFGLGFVISLEKGLGKLREDISGIKVDSDAVDYIRDQFEVFRSIGANALSQTAQFRKANADAAEREADAQEEIAKAARDTAAAMRRGAEAQADRLRQGEQARAALIGEFATPAEQFIAKQRQITAEIERLQATFAGGFMSEGDFAEQLSGLNLAARRNQQKEAARQGAEFERIGNELEGTVRVLKSFTRGTSSAFGAALLGRSAPEHGDVEEKQLSELKKSNDHLRKISERVGPPTFS